MAAIGRFIGATLLIWLLAKLLRISVLRRVKPPMHWWGSSLLAAIVAIPLAAWGAADGGEPQWAAAVGTYLPAALLWASWYRWKGWREDRRAERAAVRQPVAKSDNDRSS
jgi:hypothetical protein